MFSLSKVFHQSKLELFLVCVFGLRLYFLYGNMQGFTSNAVCGNYFSHEAMLSNVHAYVYGDRRKWKVCVTVGRHFILVASRSSLFSILSALKFFLCSL